MPPVPTRPPELHGAVFRGSSEVRSGRLTKAQLRSATWRRLLPDVYACATLPVTHRVRARAVAGVLLPGAVLSGRSAAVLWGVDLANADDDVECTVDPSCRAGAVRGVRVSRRPLPPGDVTRRGGVPVTIPLRTAIDLARIRPVDEAVVCLDQFLVSDLVSGLLSLAEVRAAAETLTGPGCRLVRQAVSLADGLAESPQESRLRLLVHRSRLPRPIAQYRVRSASGLVAKVDFAWPEAKLALEYDGWWHGQHQNVPKDRRRLNRLTAQGWTVIFVTADDLVHPVALIARIAAVLKSSGYVRAR